MTSWSGTLEAELHGLVDGQIEAGRRANALRRLASSPTDRARVEAWQAQNDLLRSTFSGVDREPVPAMLSLDPRPQLHCIPANDAPLVEPSRQTAQPRRDYVATVAALAVATVGLVASWTLLNQTEPTPPSATVALRGPVDADLTSRTSIALGQSAAPAAGASGELVTSRIPDLLGQGFRFVGAESGTSGQAPSINFRYRGPTGERLVLSVMRASKPEAQHAASTKGVLRWRSGDRVYAMAATIDAERLRAIEIALQAKSR